MQSGINAIVRTFVICFGAFLLIDVLGFIYQVNQKNNFETQVTKYVQTAGGVTPEVMAKTDKLSKNNYRGYFKLKPHGSGKPVYFKGKKYDGVYPTEWSTDHDNTPIYPALTKHPEPYIDRNGNKQQNRDITEKGSLMSLLDHPGKLFAGQFKDFAKQDIIPDIIEANKVKEVKPIGYIDKNYFFNHPTDATEDGIVIWPYNLANSHDLTNQNKPSIYKYDVWHSKRNYTDLVFVTIDPTNQKVHFNDKKLTKKQKVCLVSNGNNIMGEAYPNRWSDLKANSYPHAYGATIRYDLEINIPYLLFTENMGALKKFAYKITQVGDTVSLYREPKN